MGKSGTAVWLLFQTDSSFMTGVYSKTGLVIIGRNEGSRLEACLRSVATKCNEAVYVDSASTDQSVSIARALQFHVVELDRNGALNAARARNAGFARLKQAVPGLVYVQFLDGDCELDSDWLGTAKLWLENHPNTVAVCGRRRECFANRSIYNKLCDIEWDTPLGEALSFGGDAFIRADAFARSGGYNETFPAGEEPDLCLRLRHTGGSIVRLPAEMSRHDANILSFPAWWKRMVRGGYGAGLVYAHWRKRSPSLEVPFRFMTRSAVIWTEGWLLGSAACLVAGIFIGGLKGMLGAGLLSASVWLIQALRCSRKLWGKISAFDAFAYGVFTMLGKWPQRLGHTLLQKDITRGARPRSIQYKT